MNNLFSKNNKNTKNNNSQNIDSLNEYVFHFGGKVNQTVSDNTGALAQEIRNKVLEELNKSCIPVAISKSKEEIEREINAELEKIEQLKKVSVSNKEEIDKLNQETSASQKEIDRLSDIKSANQAQLDKLNKETSDSQKEIDRLNDVKSANENQISALNKETSDGEKEIAKLNDVKVANEKQIDTLNKEISNGEKEITKLNDVKVANEKQIDNLNKETTASQKEIDKLNDIKSTTQNQLNVIKEESSAIQKEVDKLSKIKSDNQKQIDTLNKEISNSEKEIKRLEKAKSANENSIDTLNKELSKCEKEISRLNDVKVAKQKEIERLNQEVLASQQEINSLNGTQQEADKKKTEQIGGVYSPEDEKPLTGSFTLSEPLKTEEEYAEEMADVPLVGSFGINPESIDTTPVDEIKEENVDTVEDTVTDVVEDEENAEPIGGVYALEDEKPLTGSFTLSEPLKTEEEYAEEMADVPLVGSFGINPESIDTTPVSENSEEAVKAEDIPIEDTVTNDVEDEENAEPIGGVFSLEDEKPLTGSFTLSEPLKTEEEYAEEMADVPLVGSFGINPENIDTTPVNENTEEAVKAEDIPAEDTVADVIDEENAEPIGGVYALEDEKPLTGSFTLSEPLKTEEEYAEEMADVPLVGSFGINPENIDTTPVNENTEEAVIAEDIPTEDTVTNVVEDEENAEPIGGVYALEDEKPLTGSFTLSEPLKTEEEYAEEMADVPLVGSFGIDPETINTTPISENKREAIEPITEIEENQAVETPVENNIEDDENAEPIGGVYALEDEKPLTGSFTLSEPLKTEEEYAEEMADVPLVGSFGIDPDTIILDPKILEASRAANIPDEILEQIAASVAEKLASSIAEKLSNNMTLNSDSNEDKETEKV